MNAPFGKHYIVSTKLNTFSPSSHLDFSRLILPANDLEKELLALPVFQQGYNWGKPRFGHPEGLVGLHVIEVLDNIGALEADKSFTADLRLLAITHDTFKYQEFELRKNGESRLHHGLLARQFLEQYLHDERLLTVVERHDEAYHIWRLFHIQRKPKLAADRLNALLNHPSLDLQLYNTFFECDTRTGDKLQAPYLWFQNELRKRGIKF